MKHSLVIIVTLTLIANCNCGFFNSILDTVKDTTHSITHGVGDVVHRGKNFVFGGTEINAAGEVEVKPGIVGTISHKIHDVSAAVREEVRTVIHLFDGDQVHGKGIIGRLFDRVKGRVFKIKSFLSGNGHNGQAEVGYAQTGHVHIENRPYPYRPLKNDTGVLCKKIRKYFFNKNSPATSGIRQTVSSLHEVIDRIRNNITRKRQESGSQNSEQDGTGLIDIRTSLSNVGGLQNDFEHGVEAAYDKVDDAIDEGRQTVQSSYNKAQQNSNDFIENQRRNIQNNYNQMANNADRFRSDVGQSINNTIDNQRRNIQNNYNQIANNADKFRSDIGSSIYDNIENQRRNVQNHYNQIANNADRFKSDLGQAVTDNIEYQRRIIQNYYNEFGNNADRFRSDVDQSVNNTIDNQRRNVQNNYNQMVNNADRFRSDVGSSVNDNIENQRRNIQNHYNQIANNADRFRSDLGQAVTDNIEYQRRNIQNHYNEFGNNADRLRSDVGSSLSDAGVRLREESSKVQDLMQNGYSEVDSQLQNLGRGY